MAETKSVHFSPILEQASDDTLVVTSDIGLFPEGMDFEEPNVASLSKSAEKYRLPSEDEDEDEDERRRPRKLKIALLALGFTLLLCVAGGVAIYLIKRELYNKDGHTYSANVGEQKTGFPSKNTSSQEYTSRLVAVNTMKPSLETSKEHLSMYSAKATIKTRMYTEVSRKVASPSLLRQDSNGLLKTSGLTSYWPDTYSLRFHETRSTTINGLSKNSAYDAESVSTASFQSIIASTWLFDDSRVKMSQSLSENARSITTRPSSFLTTVKVFDDSRAKMSTSLSENAPSITTPSPFVTSVKYFVQSATKTLQNVGTVMTKPPNPNPKHTWLATGTVMTEISDTRNFTSAGENTRFQQTTRHSPTLSSKDVWLPTGTMIREFSDTRNVTSAGENTKFQQMTRHSPNPSSKDVWLTTGTVIREFSDTRNVTSARENTKFQQMTRHSPNPSSKDVWLPAGTVIREFSDTRNFTSAGENTKFQQTTTQSGQRRFGRTSFTSVTTSKPQFPSDISEKSNELQTGGMAIKTETIIATSRLPATRSTDITLSAKHLLSNFVANTLNESSTQSNFNREMMTSRPAPTSYIVKNTSNQNVSSNNISLFSRSQWTTWMQQISSSPHYRSSTSSIQIYLFSKASSTTFTSGSSTYLDKDTETSQSTIFTPLLPALSLSATKFISQSEKPSSTLNQESSSAVVTFSPSLISTLSGRSTTVAEIQTTKPTMANSAGVHLTTHTTASNTVTAKRRRNSSSSVLVKNKSMVTPDAYTETSVVPQSTLINFVVSETLSPHVTHAGLSTIKDRAFNETFQKTSALLSSTHQSLKKERSLNMALNTDSMYGFQTNATVLNPTAGSTASMDSSPVELDTLPISSVSYHSSFGNPKTVASKATIMTNLSQTNARCRSTSESKSTLQAMASLSTVKLTPTSQLVSTVFPIVSSSFPHLKSVEGITKSLSRHKAPSVSTKKHQITFPYTLHKGTSDTLAHSAIRSIGIPTSARFLPTETTSMEVTSQLLTVGLQIVTSRSSIHQLEFNDSYKTPSVSTTAFQHTLSSSHTLISSTVTHISIATVSTVIRSTALSSGLLSSAINNSIGVSSNISLNGSLATHSPHPKTNSTASSVLASNSAFTSQETHSRDTVSSRYSSVLATNTPIMNENTSRTSSKVMDGSLIIRNVNYHTNLSNPKTTMFKTLAEKVETPIMDIVSVNNTDVLDVKVKSFRNGSVIVDFYLKVRYDSPFSDQQYAQLLSEANGTLWRGYHVTNITVTLRTIEVGSSELSRGQDDAGLSKTVIIATLTVFVALLIAVGSFGVYYCKKKEMCHMSKVKPADSPIPPSELEKIQPVRRGTWVMKDEPFLTVDAPTDPNCKSSSFCETLSMEVLERKDTEPEERLDPDLLRESTKCSLFEPDYEDNDVDVDVDDLKIHDPDLSTSRNMHLSNLNIDNDNRPVSGLSSNSSTLFEDEHEC